MIGILTFHRAVNYGGVLQAFALQNSLEELDIPNEVIDYRCAFIEKYYAPKPMVSPIHLRHYLYELKGAPIKKRRRQAFERFTNLRLTTSSPYTKTDLLTIASKYSAVITGSDQVWNLAVSGGDVSYALDWVSDGVKKLSYAASIGPADVKQEYIDSLTPWLKQYDILSVREPAAIPVVERLSGKKAVVDVDPTVLPNQHVWESIANMSELGYSKFIFVYVMQPSDILYDIAEELSEKFNLKILTISMVPNTRRLGEAIQAAGIEDFLWMIKNAEYVVTNSFHGLMFSMRFHKEFFWSYQTGKQMSNPRFDMLVEQYGIDVRCCCSREDAHKCSTLDFDNIDRIMDGQRVISKRNILYSIKGEK